MQHILRQELTFVSHGSRSHDDSHDSHDSLARWLAVCQDPPNPPLRATIDPNYQKLFSQSLIVEISRKRAALESDREHFWGIHFYNFPLFSSLLQVDLLPSGASLVWPRPLNSWSALDLCTFAYPSKDTTDFESLFE